MALDYTKKTSRKRIPVLNIIHLVFGILALVILVFFIIDADRYKKLIPIMFLVASFMNGFEAVYKIKNLPHGKKNFSGVVGSMILAIIWILIALFTGVMIYL